MLCTTVDNGVASVVRLSTKELFVLCKIVDKGMVRIV